MVVVTGESKILFFTGAGKVSVFSVKEDTGQPLGAVGQYLSPFCG